jgi:hypothetical protein
LHTWKLKRIVIVENEEKNNTDTTKKPNWFIFNLELKTSAGQIAKSSVISDVLTPFHN